MTEGKRLLNGPKRRIITSETPSTTSKSLVGVIDEGTSSVQFSLYSVPYFKEVAKYQIDLKMITPQDGWFEQNPLELMDAVYECCEKACAQLPALGYSVADISCIGVTNQRETTVVWDSRTGQPLYNALVWKDIRSEQSVDRVLSKLDNQDKNHFKHISGLPVSPYFTALKLRWLFDNVAEVRKVHREGFCKAGTIDTWIVWNLTKGALHITDVTNASRTLLMDIETLHWHPQLLRTFKIDRNILPEIRSSSEIYGPITSDRCVLTGVPISGIIGNQHASLLGQMCVKPGQAKNTYRSGCFLLCNMGERPVISAHGLITTVAYKLGPNKPAMYALEGSVAVGGHALRWLENRVRLLKDFTQAEKCAEEVATTGDVYFVPAFTGLYAPYWRKEARGLIIGLTQYSTKHHIVRAALEAICFQTRDILECMHQESGFQLNKLHADGSISMNNLLMQLQADTAGLTVFRSQVTDTTTFGAALCAAQAEGIDLFNFHPDELQYDVVDYDTFLPTSTDDERHHRYGKWKRAVERSMDWVIKKPTRQITDETYKLLSSIPPAIFVMTTFAMIIHATANK
ncbi:glycerol kinase-like [Bactrocera tryoni]|uniref:glycerol kinase-like n=1 Tax=Bactrocera tryoni TaxID=59916 RepID=UPI001A985A85|nr:glycerol kinase-like [Bactrocera tryoni]XP_039964895.1 glycerol kinase-like [Bactrocera tryoni]XP_039964896.1 glycerol kinase-like [Bactrocera tryoni]XP_039964897.1 glycerol kinase-like [Bactrocera tryoni]XP_039964898.1 glycerol kinase-like [Bactrocera tryoni]